MDRLPAERPRPRAARATSAPAGGGLEALQRLAGNGAVRALVQRQPETLDDTLFDDTAFGDGVGDAVPADAAPSSPVTRPTKRRGDLDDDVGLAQQKLNLAGADPRLEVDAEFGSRTERAVRAFQQRHGLAGSGVLDQPTWAALDQAVPDGPPGPDGEPGPPLTGRPADPLATIETPVHPTLRQGASGTAVNELHEKLNRTMGLSLVIAVSSEDASGVVYDDQTETAVAAFQRREHLGFDGVAGPQTWARLDEVSPGAMIGRREFLQSEQVRGERGFRGGAVNYDFEIEGSQTAPTGITVRVGYDFTVFDGLDDVPGRLFAGIRQVWNRFEAIEFVEGAGAQPRAPVPITFEPQLGEDQRVEIVRGPGPSNASKYFITDDMDLAQLGGHEFGHHMGLADEYQQSAADHERHTGEAVPVGEIHGDAPPEQIASAIHTAVHSQPESDRGEATLAVVRSHGLEQGAFAQQVARRYVNMFGQSVTDAINDNVPQTQDEGSLTKRRLCTQPFTYNEDGLMAGAEASEDHKHDVEPRHVRHVVELLAQAVGGTWEPAVR